MKSLILYILLLTSAFAIAQEQDKTLTAGNDEYNEKKFVDAEANYRISHSKFPKRTVSPFNLGNAIYKQNQIAEAKISYLKALENIKSRPQLHKLYHNLGNTLMKEKEYTGAVEAFKNALRNNPSDDESRYNYALAKKLLKENPPKDDKKDKKDDKKKDDKKDKKEDKKEDKKDGEKEKKEDKKDGEKDKDKKDDKGNENKGNKPNDNSQPKPMPNGISKQRTENLLDAVNNEEKKIQDKVNAKKIKGQPIQAEKDW